MLDVAIHCDEAAEVRAVVLTGSGKMFCAGGDLKVFAAQGEKGLPLYQRDHPGFSRSDIPIQLDGCAGGSRHQRNRRGGGLSLALTTDVAIAAESAKFTMAYTKVGLAPDGSSSYFLARMVGLRRAKEMALLNPVLSARQAMEWGLVNQVVADDQATVRSPRKWRHDLARGTDPVFR